MNSNGYFTEKNIRAIFKLKLELKSQAEIARECGVSPQNISAMAKGAPINGKVLHWLRFKRVEGLYERVK